MLMYNDRISINTMQAENVIAIKVAQEEQQCVANEQLREDCNCQTIQLQEAHDEIGDLRQRVQLLKREDEKTKKAAR